MKKLIMTSAVLLVALMAQAQTKIALQLENGYKAVYTEESNINMAGQATVKMTTETEYAVSDVTADGAIITVTLTDVQSDGDDGNPMVTLMQQAQSITRGIAIKAATNADGQVQGIKNIDEVRAEAEEVCNSIVAQLLEANPALAQMMPKEELVEQLLEHVSEEALLKSLTNSGVLSLAGKTLVNGASETLNDGDGFKMKRMYFMAGKNIIANSTLDMTTDEIKAFIIQQVEESMPDQAEMVKQNIDMFIGQMKMEKSEKETFELQDNGWPKSIKGEMNQDMMGQQISGTSTTTLK